MEERQLEMADELTNAERVAGIEASRRALAPQVSEDFDGEHCIDCGVEIPKQRLAMGRIRCTDCESKVERMRKLGIYH